MSPQEILAFWKLAENPVLWFPCWIFFVIVLLILNATIVCGETVLLYGWAGGGLNQIFRRCFSKVGLLSTGWYKLPGIWLSFLTFQSNAREVGCLRVSPSFVIWWLWGENWLQKFRFCIETRTGRLNLYQETAIGQKWRYLPEKGCDRLNNRGLSFLNENRSNNFWSEKCCNTGKKCTNSHTLVQRQTPEGLYSLLCCSLLPRRTGFHSERL